MEFYQLLNTEMNEKMDEKVLIKFFYADFAYRHIESSGWVRREQLRIAFCRSRVASIGRVGFLTQGMIKKGLSLDDCKLHGVAAAHGVIGAACLSERKIGYVTAAREIQLSVRFSWSADDARMGKPIHFRHRCNSWVSWSHPHVKMELVSLKIVEINITAMKALMNGDAADADDPSEGSSFEVVDGADAAAWDEAWAQSSS